MMDELTHARFKRDVAALRNSMRTGDDVADPMASLMEIAEKFNTDIEMALDVFLGLDDKTPNEPSAAH